MTNIRLFVISDIRLYRDGLCEILGRREGIEVAGVAADVEGAGVIIRRLRHTPDVALVDIAIPNGIEEVRELAEAIPALRILAITVPEHEGDVLACVESGAAGFVTRDASIEQLVDALEGIARGEALCSPRMTAALLRHVSELARERVPAMPLTMREQEILRLIDDGLSNKQIGQHLCIELPTVKNHVHRIIEKLGVTNRTQAAARMRGHLSQITSED